MDYGNDVNPKNDHDKQLDYEKYASKYKNPDVKLEKDWKYFPSVTELQNELTLLSTTTIAHIAKVQNWVNIREGVKNFQAITGKSNVVQKLTRKQNEWRYAALEDSFLSSKTLFHLDSNYDKFDPAVEEMDDILNYQFTKEIDLVAFINEYVRTAVDLGTVILKVAWEYEEREEEILISSSDEFDEETDVLLEELENGVIKVRRIHVTKNKPSIEICDLESVHISADAKGNADEAKTIIHQFPMTFSDLKLDGRYSNLDKLQLSDFGTIDKNTSYGLDAIVANMSVQDIPRTELLVNEYWGYYDITGTGIVDAVVISWIGDTIVRMEKNPYPLQEMPFVIVQNLPILRSNYGEADAELLGDNQAIVSALIRGAIDIMGKTATGQRITQKNLFDQYNQELFEKGKDCEINNMGVTPDQAIFVQNFPNIPESFSYLINLVNNESEALTGIKAFSQGITGTSLGNTATGIRSAMDATAKRELSIVRRLANGLIKVGKKITRLNIEYLTDEDIMKITGAEEVFLRRTQYQSVTYVDMYISTPELRKQKADVLSFMLQTLGQTMDETLRNIILSKITKLQGEEDIVSTILNHRSQPDPIEVAKHEAELQEIQAKINQSNAMAKYYDAMAKKAMSEADLKDLDMISQMQEAPINRVSKEADTEFKIQQANVMKQNAEEDQQQIQNSSKQV